MDSICHRCTHKLGFADDVLDEESLHDPEKFMQSFNKRRFADYDKLVGVLLTYLIHAK